MSVEPYEWLCMIDEQPCIVGERMFISLVDLGWSYHLSRGINQGYSVKWCNLFEQS